MEPLDVQLVLCPSGRRSEHGLLRSQHALQDDHRASIQLLLLRLRDSAGRSVGLLGLGPGLDGLFGTLIRGEPRGTGRLHEPTEVAGRSSGLSDGVRNSLFSKLEEAGDKIDSAYESGDMNKLLGAIGSLDAFINELQSDNEAASHPDSKTWEEQAEYIIDRM